MAHILPYFISVRVTALPWCTDLPIHRLLCLPGAPSPGYALHMCPHSSVARQYRNLNLLSIGYVSRPRLRPRLPQGRSALPWKPWIFGLKDSHLHLATHSGILSSYTSTRSYRSRFSGLMNAPLPICNRISLNFGDKF